MVSFEILKTKPLDQPESYSAKWLLVGILHLFAAGSLSASFIRFEGNNQIAARLMIRLLGIGSAAAALISTKEIQSLAKWSAYRDVIREDEFIKAIAQPRLTPGKITAVGEDSADEISIYEWLRLRSEATGIMISGNPGHGKSSVGLWALGWLTQLEGAFIEICDPHAGVNRGWAENGFLPVSTYPDIEQKFKDALAEFKARKTRAENGQDIGRKYILVADETDSYEDNFRNPDLVAKVQTVLGKEGRKYGIILIFVTHTSNVTNKKIDAQERDCFVSINLGVSAMAKADKAWGKKSIECQLLRQQAYPCVVVSNGIPHVAIHPTHAEYSEFKQSGNPPKNLMQIYQIGRHQPPPAATGQPPGQPPATDYLERAWAMEFDLGRHRAATEPPEQPPATETEHSCPDCGGHRTKWHDRKNDRRKCNDCGATWRIN